jgi:Tat protein secretion system quality control protein TatD with DNase activity
MKLIDAHIHLSDTEYAKCTDELVAETDSPVNYRKLPFNGQLTRPSFIITVVEAVAEAKNFMLCAPFLCVKARVE